MSDQINVNANTLEMKVAILEVNISNHLSRIEDEMNRVWKGQDDMRDGYTSLISQTRIDLNNLCGELSKDVSRLESRLEVVEGADDKKKAKLVSDIIGRLYQAAIAGLVGYIVYLLTGVLGVKQ